MVTKMMRQITDARELRGPAILSQPVPSISRL